MAFPTINAQQELNNRKILEDLQRELKKPVVPATTSAVIPQYMQMSPSSVADPIINTPSARSVWNQAINQSHGFFIQQDSAFGNNILPVLPRYDNPK